MTSNSLAKSAEVVYNRMVHPGFHEITFSLPEIVHDCRPGQFVMMRPGIGTHDPLLGRPLGIYDWDVKEGTVTVVFAVQGKCTRLLSKTRPGDKIPVIGPLGNGYKFYDTDKNVIIIAGGMGIASLYPVIKHFSAKKDVKTRILIGAHHAGKILADDKIAALGMTMDIYTDDGSRGTKGWPTDTLKEMVTKEKFDRVYCCGTLRMMANTSGICEEAGLPCQVSLEERMGCGTGICMGCTWHHKNPDGSEDLVRVCHEGPVFESKEVVWRV